MTINEAGVYFFPAGGHNHDGENSSLIDVNAYSIFDFNWNIGIGTPGRIQNQERNFFGLSQLVDSTVRIMLTNEAGVIIQPGSINGSSLMANTVQANTVIVTGSIDANLIQAGTITANQIAAGTITANEILAGTITANQIAASVVLVNQAILSNNYVTGVSGWLIDGDGTAEFDAASIRGTIEAAELFIDANNAWNSSGFVLGGANGIFTSNGVVKIGTSVVIEGTIEADSVSTPGVDIFANGVLQASNFVIRANGAFGNNNFAVDASGNLFATNVDITGEINATSGSISGNLVVGGTITSTNISGVNISGVNISGSNISGVNISGSRIVATAVDTVFINQAGTNAPIVIGNLPNGVDMRASGVTVYGGNFGINSFISGNEIGTTGILRGQFVVGISPNSVAAINSHNLRRRDSDGRFLIEISRRNLKKDIANIENGIDLIKKLNPVSFRWKDESSYGCESFNDEIKECIMLKKEYGFIAEDVESAVPDLAVYSFNNDSMEMIPTMWQQNGVISLCVASIKELISEINELKSKVSELESYLFNGPNNEV